MNKQDKGVLIAFIAFCCITIFGLLIINESRKEEPVAEQPAIEQPSQDEYLQEEDLPKNTSSNDLDLAEAILEERLATAAAETGFYDYSLERVDEEDLIVVIINYTEAELAFTSKSEWNDITDTFTSVCGSWYDSFQNMGMDVNVGIMIGDVAADTPFYGAVNGSVAFDVPNGIPYE